MGLAALWEPWGSFTPVSGLAPGAPQHRPLCPIPGMVHSGCAYTSTRPCPRAAPSPAQPKRRERAAGPPGAAAGPGGKRSAGPPPAEGRGLRRQGPGGENRPPPTPGLRHSASPRRAPSLPGCPHCLAARGGTGGGPARPTAACTMSGARAAISRPGPPAAPPLPAGSRTYSVTPRAEAEMILVSARGLLGAVVQLTEKTNERGGKLDYDSR